MTRDRSTIRHILIRKLVTEHEISSQGELVTMLGDAGHQVTQSTVSRDLAAIGVVKADEGTDRERYVLSGRELRADDGFDELRRVLGDYLEGAVPSGNLVVLRVRSATAGTVAAALDASPPAGVVGTLAGDDTVIVIADDAAGGGAVANTIMKILEG